MKLKQLYFLFLIIISQANAQIPESFVNVLDEIPSIKIELRYYSHNNFVGKPIDGYTTNKVYLTKEATKQLKIIQEKLSKQNLSLKIFDAYRPQRAVNNFWVWAKDVNDTLMKQQFYPKVAKKNLFKEQYIATKSRHSSGSTVDITLVDLVTNEELDMGSSFDFFGNISWVNNHKITPKQLENRKLLLTIMTSNGFYNYPKEWWHYTLRNEPFRNQYFDFIIE